jgi:anti-sigma-K factor RskA
VHDQLADRSAAYALGALDPAEQRQFEVHLAECAICAAEVRSFADVGILLAGAAPAAEPAAAVRPRLAGAVSRRSPRSGGWLAAAASVVFAVALGGYAAQLRGRVAGLESQLREATQRAAATEGQMAEARRVAFDATSQVAVLAAPDLTRIDLAGQPSAPTASGRAFWSRTRGLVFTASNLPAPPRGRAYQLWVLTSQPSPISAGMLAADASGRITARFDTPLDLPRPVAMAVTLEPAGGVPAPTGDKYLVGPASH